MNLSTPTRFDPFSDLPKDALQHFFGKIVQESSLSSQPSEEFRILDLGCGAGRDLLYLDYLFAQNPNPSIPFGYKIDLVGIDQDPDLVRSAQATAQKFGSQARFLAQNAGFYSPEKSSLNAIWAHLFFNFSSPTLCKRILQTLFNASRHPAWIFASIFQPARSTEQTETSSLNGPLFFHSPDDFASLLHQSGFTVQEIARSRSSRFDRDVLGFYAKSLQPSPKSPVQ